MKKIKVFAIIMIMVMVLTGSTPSNVEAKTKASITVTNKSTGKKIGKKVTLKKGQKVQLKVKYGKKVVTKKAKYKTSDKNIATVSKKGKITAKSAGTCTVKVTYKKAVKKIRITVKATEATTEERVLSYKERKEKQKSEIKKNMRTEIILEDLNAVTAETPYVEASEDDCKRYRQMLIDNYQNDPNPSCAHDYKPASYISDIGDLSNNFGGLYQEHLFLRTIRCEKCGQLVTTNPVPYLDAIKYTSDELAKAILCYHTALFSADIMKECGIKHGIKHKHKYIYEYSPWKLGSWTSEMRCAYCNGKF